MDIKKDGLEARIDTSELGQHLAILGGSPIRLRQWPKWPRATSSTQRNLLNTLHSTKWTISGQSDSIDSNEYLFSKAFSTYCGVAHCVPCGSGSAGLTIALQALNIGPGDEVIVPGLTWVACASAVCHIGAIPILVDIDPNSFCMSTSSIVEAITKNTRAILMVHLYSSLASIDEILDIASEHKISVIEDASQAHGAKYKGRRTGSFGNIGVFSMQQSKLLTSGEGGACVTDDKILYQRMQQFRADGRVYASSNNRDPYCEIIPLGEVLGRNHCLSEFHAGILLDALTRLDFENNHRHRMFSELEKIIEQIPGVTLVTGIDCDIQTYYKICLQFDKNYLNHLPINLIARILAEELSLPVQTVDPPLNKNPLYQPLKSPYIGRLENAIDLYEPSRFDLPKASEVAQCCLTIPHWVLLGDKSDLIDIQHALLKILRYKKKLAQVDSTELLSIRFQNSVQEFIDNANRK